MLSHFRQTYVHRGLREGKEEQVFKKKFWIGVGVKEEGEEGRGRGKGSLFKSFCELKMSHFAQDKQLGEGGIGGCRRGRDWRRPGRERSGLA